MIYNLLQNSTNRKISKLILFITIFIKFFNNMKKYKLINKIIPQLIKQKKIRD